jgi:hypothetical protein
MGTTRVHKCLPKKQHWSVFWSRRSRCQKESREQGRVLQERKSRWRQGAGDPWAAGLGGGGKALQVSRFGSGGAERGSWDILRPSQCRKPPPLSDGLLGTDS